MCLKSWLLKIINFYELKGIQRHEDGGIDDETCQETTVQFTEKEEA